MRVSCPPTTRAGMFGYGRTTRPEDLTRGTANTIAVLGVTGQPGPWAAGGRATVRALTQAPYVNGPDGFGSGQADGMVVGMADGSTRFVSKDVDPHILEQLALIHGEPEATAALLEPRPLRAGPSRAGGPAEKPAGQAGARPIGPQPAGPGPKQLPAQANADVPVPPARPPAPVIDVASRLSVTIVQIDSGPMGLVDFVRLAADLSGSGGLPVTFDPDALVRLGVSPRDPAGVHLSHATVREIIEKAVGSHGLALVVENNQVLVTSPARDREPLRSVQYAVTDLAPDPQDASRLAGMIGELVAPESWKSAGRPGIAGRPRDDAEGGTDRGAAVAGARVLRAAAHGPPPAAAEPFRCRAVQPEHATGSRGPGLAAHAHRELPRAGAAAADPGRAGRGHAHQDPRGLGRTERGGNTRGRPRDASCGSTTAGRGVGRVAAAAGAGLPRGGCGAVPSDHGQGPGRATGPGILPGGRPGRRRTGRSSPGGADQEQRGQRHLERCRRTGSGLFRRAFAVPPGPAIAAGPRGRGQALGGDPCGAEGAGPAPAR